MNDSSPQHSVWIPESLPAEYPPLREGLEVDVAVVGGGIAGLSTACLLQRAGLNVAVIEAATVGCGTTGHSTAKVTSLHSQIYSQLEKKFDLDAAQVYAQANQAGLQQVASFVEEFNIDCQFERQAAFTYTCDHSRVEEVRQEAEAARRAGLPASFTTETELPFAVLGAVRVEEQAQFQPYEYCRALARAFIERGGRIFEQTRATNVSQASGKCKVHTHTAELQAEHVVLATLLPFLDRGGFFARTYPSRSYGIAVRLDGSAPEGMYINVESPTRSVRPLADRSGMLVIGEQHKVGHDPDTRARYASLESWARRHFPVRSVENRWSAQDYMSVDSVPYIGRSPLGSERIWVATGFNKWGLTAGTAAAMILTDLIQERENPWAGFFNAARADVLPSAKKLITENLDVAKRFVGDRIRSAAAPKLHELTPGHGAIVSHDGKKVAAYRDDSGRVHACSPACTHMGCYVQWNTAEKSWDCPCHGSRFGYDGEVLQGPAVNPLESKNVT